MHNIEVYKQAQGFATELQVGGVVELEDELALSGFALRCSLNASFFNLSS
jgi:hypothetical protein